MARTGLLLGVLVAFLILFTADTTARSLTADKQRSPRLVERLKRSFWGHSYRLANCPEGCFSDSDCFNCAGKYGEYYCSSGSMTGYNTVLAERIGSCKPISYSINGI